MAEVTDPEILKLLNGTGGAEVTDPKILRQLNGEEEPSSTMDFLKTLPSAAVRGFTGFLGGASKSQDVTGMSPKQIEALPTAQEMPGPEEFTGAVEKNLFGPLYQPQTGAGQYGEAVGEALGNPFSWVGPGGVLAKTAANVGGALGGEAASQLAKGSAFETPARFLGSLVGGHVTLSLPKAYSPLKSLEPGRQALIDTLKKEGITDLGIGQQRGNEGLTRIESLAGNSLFAGNKAQNLAESQKSQLMGNLIKRGGDTSGATAATPDVIDSNLERIAGNMDKRAKALPVTFSKQFGDKLQALEQDMQRYPLTAENKNNIIKNIENIRTAFVTKGTPPIEPSAIGGRPIHPDVIAAMRAEAPGGPIGQGLAGDLAQGIADINAGAAQQGNIKGVMPGKAYQTLTQRNSPLDMLQKSPVAVEKMFGNRIRDALDEAMWKSANARGTREGVGRREAAKGLLEDRRQWRTWMIISKMVAGGGADAAKGYGTPAQLRMALTSTPQDKLFYARKAGMKGENTDVGLNNLSRAANAIMTPLPNSGTPAGMQALENLNLASTLRGVGEGVGGAAAGGAAFGPLGAAVGALGVPITHGLIGRALHSEPVRNYFTNQLPGQKWIAEHRPGASPAWLSMVNVLRKQPNSAEAQQ